MIYLKKNCASFKMFGDHLAAIFFLWVLAHMRKAEREAEAEHLRARL